MVNRPEIPYELPSEQLTLVSREETLLAEIEESKAPSIHPEVCVPSLAATETLGEKGVITVGKEPI